MLGPSHLENDKNLDLASPRVGTCLRGAARQSLKPAQPARAKMKLPRQPDLLGALPQRPSTPTTAHNVQAETRCHCAATRSSDTASLWAPSCWGRQTDSYAPAIPSDQLHQLAIRTRWHLAPSPRDAPEWMQPAGHLCSPHGPHLWHTPHGPHLWHTPHGPHLWHGIAPDRT